MANIQKAMIGLMTQLSSYSIQYLREINDKDVVPINWSAIRIGEASCTADIDEGAKVTTKILGMEIDSATYKNIEVMVDKNYNVFDVEVQLEKNISLKLDALIEDVYNTDITITFPGHVMDAEYPGQISGYYSQKGYLGHEIYLSLTPEERETLKFAV
jgi:hypothetical protein